MRFPKYLLLAIFFVVASAGVSFAQDDDTGDKPSEKQFVILVTDYTPNVITVNTVAVEPIVINQTQLRVIEYSVSPVAEHAPLFVLADQRFYWRKDSYYINPILGKLSKGATRINAPPNKAC